MISEYLTTSQTARLFHVTRFTVLNWIKQQKLQAVSTLGGHQRIPQKAIEDLLKQKQQGSKIPVQAHISKQIPEVKKTVKPISTGRPAQAKAAEFARVMRKGSFISGKFIASIKSGFSLL
ncbi:MAG: helix-turn-helix domain-containing protein [Candidatus Omnitrophica bacterium]|nr:helix-turn-helix domain-containing protein [Candidatus Omnitrophota bacterium]